MVTWATFLYTFGSGFALGYFLTKWYHKSKEPQPEPFECNHADSLCNQYGCPDDPNWKGDGCK